MSARNRREFLRQSGRIGAALAAAGLLTTPVDADEPVEVKKVADTSPNNRLRVAVLGGRGTSLPGLKGTGRGLDHVKFIAGCNDCEVAVVCDCDESVVGPTLTQAEKQQGKLPRYEKDLRRVIDDPKIDIVSIALPNHWHALAAIWAMRAGKHVYVEKPVSHNVWEGRRMVEAAKHYKRMCQAGTQCRSSTANVEAVEFLRSGKIGKVTLARGLCYKPRLSIGKVSGDGEVPSSMDYDLWCGPAPKRPPRRSRVHYDWHWQWDYGNGDLGNQGIHQVDIARWGLGKAGLPKSVMSLGGRYGYSDDGETPNTQVSVFDYGDATLIFEVRGLLTLDALADERGRSTPNKAMQAMIGNVFYGTDGMIVCTSYDDAVAVSQDDEILRVFKAKKEDDHFGNFVAAVRANDSSLLTAEIEQGHVSSALCHLANVSYRLGRDVPLDSAELSPNSGADGSLTVRRMRKHLATNGVKDTAATCRVGVKLDIDAATERFIGNEAANQRLEREYRKGFEVPTRF